MNNEIITPDFEKIKDIIKYLNFFQKNYLSDEKIYLFAPEKDFSNPFIYKDEVSFFLSDILKDKFFQSFQASDSWFNELNNFIAKPDNILSADIYTIIKVLTTFIASEKKMNGVIAKVIKIGLIHKILIRLNEIYNTAIEEGKIDIDSRDIRINSKVNGIEVVAQDVRWLTENAICSSKNPKILERFENIKNADADFLKSLLKEPVNSTILDCNMNYAIPDSFNNGYLFKADSMEEKWDIVLLDSQIYFMRSWTGEVAFIANIDLDIHNIFSVTGIILNNNMVKNKAIIIQEVDYLIHSHILNQKTPCPIPYNIENKFDAIAQYSFSEFGKRALWATYDYEV